MEYNGAATARWASQNARTRQPFSHSCALFASRGLWIGGLPQVRAWNESSETVMRGVLGTPTALRANELVRYLTAHQLASLAVVYEEPRFEPTSIPAAKRGDILAFDWYGEYGDGRWSHVAIITAVRQSIPYVSEWGTAGRFGLKCRYTCRRWDWSHNYRVPLREVRASLRVGLLTIGR